MDEPRKRISIWSKTYTCALLANILLTFSQQTVSALMTTYAKYLGAGAMVTGLVTGLYFAVAVAARPFAGPVITKCDKKKVMIYTYIIGIVTSVGYAFCKSIPMFILVRIFHGIEFAFVGSLSLTIIGDCTPKERLGLAVGMIGVGISLCAALGPNLGLAINNWATAKWGESGGYTAVFLASAVLMVVAIIPAFLLPNSKPSKEALAGLGPWYKNIICKEAILPTVLMCLTSISSMLFTSYLVPVARERGIENIGLYFTVHAVVTLATRPFCGKLVDKLGIEKVFYPGCVVYILTFVIAAFATKLWMLFIAGFIAAISYGTVSPAIMALTVRCTTAEKRGVASNTLYFGMDIGNFLSPTLGGIVYALWGYASMFLIVGIVPILLSLLYFSLAWKTAKEHLDPEG